MIYDRKTIEAVERLHSAPWQGVVFRHMFADFPPERENSRGARWNPPETPAIYSSLERETALAEAAYYIALQPIRPRARRRIYRLNVALSSVIDLSDWDQLVTLGLSRGSLQSIDHADCQIIGGAVEWLRHDGLLVPSGRSEGTNLVIFPNRQGPDYEFEVLDFEEV